MKKIKALGQTYIILFSILAASLIYVINKRIIDIVIVTTIGIFGLILINNLLRVNVANVTLILSIYNLMISGSMFFSNIESNNTIIDNISIIVSIFSLVIMLISIIFINKSKPYHVKQFIKWSINGVMFSVLTMLIVVLITQIENSVIETILSILCAVSFIFMIISIYKLEHHRNRM